MSYATWLIDSFLRQGANPEALATVIKELR